LFNFFVFLLIQGEKWKSCGPHSFLCFSSLFLCLPNRRNTLFLLLFSASQTLSTLILSYQTNHKTLVCKNFLFLFLKCFPKLDMKKWKEKKNKWFITAHELRHNASLLDMYASCPWPAHVRTPSIWNRWYLAWESNKYFSTIKKLIFNHLTKWRSKIYHSLSLLDFFVFSRHLPTTPPFSSIFVPIFHHPSPPPLLWF
jgi:hypothetical protein